MNATREPAVIVGMITSLAAAVIACLVAFGLPLTDDQVQALLGLVAVVGPIVAAVITRGKVTPVEPQHRLDT